MSEIALDSYNWMLESIKNQNNIKYTPYRIALKLIALQKCTYCKYFFFLIVFMLYV